jgi:hypothetical protein
MQLATVRFLQLKTTACGSHNHNGRDEFPVTLLQMYRRVTLNIKCGDLSGVAENSRVRDWDDFSLRLWVSTLKVS